MIVKGLSPEVQDVFRRGFRVLIDRDGTLERLAVEPGRKAVPPTTDEFNEHLNDFLYHAIWTAKKIRRGELWVAKSCCDGYMKRLLLRMIEWHARAHHGWNYDTWFNGRFLESWAEPQVLSELAPAFAHYELDDLKKALGQTVRLHKSLSTETAKKLDYKFSNEMYSETFRLIENYISD